MTCYVSSGTLNSTHSLTFTLLDATAVQFSRNLLMGKYFKIYAWLSLHGRGQRHMTAFVNWESVNYLCTPLYYTHAHTHRFNGQFPGKPGLRSVGKNLASHFKAFDLITKSAGQLIKQYGNSHMIGVKVHIL